MFCTAPFIVAILRLALDTVVVAIALVGVLCCHGVSGIGAAGGVGRLECDISEWSALHSRCGVVLLRSLHERTGELGSWRG